MDKRCGFWCDSFTETYDYVQTRKKNKGKEKKRKMKRKAVEIDLIIRRNWESKVEWQIWIHWEQKYIIYVSNLKTQGTKKKLNKMKDYYLANEIFLCGFSIFFEFDIFFILFLFFICYMNIFIFSSLLQNYFSDLMFHNSFYLFIFCSSRIFVFFFKWKKQKLV